MLTVVVLTVAYTNNWRRPVISLQSHTAFDWVCIYSFCAGWRFWLTYHLFASSTQNRLIWQTPISSSTLKYISIYPIQSQPYILYSQSLTHNNHIVAFSLINRLKWLTYLCGRENIWRYRIAPARARLGIVFRKNASGFLTWAQHEFGILLRTNKFMLRSCLSEKS